MRFEPIEWFNPNIDIHIRRIHGKSRDSTTSGPHQSRMLRITVVGDMGSSTQSDPLNLDGLLPHIVKRQVAAH